MLRPESEFLCIHGQRNHMYFGHLYKLQRSMRSSKKKISAVMQRDCCESYFALFSGTQRVSEISTQFYLDPSARCEDEKYPAQPCLALWKASLISLRWALPWLGSPYAFGDGQYLRHILTAALVEAMSVRHPSGGVVGNDANPPVPPLLVTPSWETEHSASATRSRSPTGRGAEWHLQPKALACGSGKLP